MEEPQLVNSYGRLYVVETRVQRLLVRKKSIFSAFMDTSISLGGTMFVHGVWKATRADVTRILKKKRK